MKPRGKNTVLQSGTCLIVPATTATCLKLIKLKQQKLDLWENLMEQINSNAYS